jgi:hypothetical protein
MSTLRSIKRLWRKDSSGLLIPGGMVSNVSRITKNSFLAAKDKAVRLESFFDEASVTIPINSDLAILISSTKELADSWLTKRAEDIPLALLFQTAHFERIADAVLPLEEVPGKKPFLKKMTSGSLNFFDRKPSHAKDILWELELWSFLLRRGFTADLREPDIIVEFDGSIIAIPCKKIYSPKGTSKVLSNAVAQIEKNYDFGLVALNIDEITPQNTILKAANYKQFCDFVGGLNISFIKSNERHFRKYLSNGRLISVLVSTTLLANLYEEKIRFSNASQSTVWTIPGLNQRKDEQLNNFYRQLMQ